MLAVVCAPHASALTLLAEDFPPLNFSNDGGQTVIGASTDLLREALRRSGTRADSAYKYTGTLSSSAMRWPTCSASAVHSAIVTPATGTKGMTSMAPMRGCSPV